MICPGCGGELVSTKYEDYPVRRCSSCGGYWISGEILLGIINARKEKIPAEALAVARDWHSKTMPKKELPDELVCPSCGKMLSRGVYGYDSGVVIDRCPAGCGVWLDKGELVALQAFDEVWDKKSREVFEEKGLGAMLDEIENEKDPETEVIRRGILGKTIIGRLADILVDFLE
ncbi:hypothetical protein DRQ36_02530 [bacterium]|nr:MAG: hypothetical protein DRQ36_02530 [bacterium]